MLFGFFRGIGVVEVSFVASGLTVVRHFGLLIVEMDVTRYFEVIDTLPLDNYEVYIRTGCYVSAVQDGRVIISWICHLQGNDIDKAIMTV